MKNNKGFTVIELLASFTLTMIIVIFLFQIILDLKDIYIEDSIKSQINRKNAIIATTINNALDKENINGGECIQETRTCTLWVWNQAELNYSKTFNIIINENQINVGDEVIKLEEDKGRIDTNSIKVESKQAIGTKKQGNHNSYIKISYNIVNDKLKESVPFNYIYTFMSTPPE